MSATRLAFKFLRGYVLKDEVMIRENCCPTLNTLRHILREEGTAVGAEEKSSPFGWRAVDSFNCGEGVFSFVVVRELLDLLAQLLLNEATTTAKSSFVVVGGAVDAGFVQAIPLGEQVADGGVNVIKPVLMLAVCSTEDSQGGRLDCVS
ncbi:hypothetical protein SprV_0401694800 [Sparganum proliferum]